MAAPGEIDVCDIRALVPTAFVDQDLQACAIGARLAAEHARGGLTPRLTLVDAVCGELTRALLRIGCDRVGIVGFVEFGNRAHRAVDQVHLVRERIAEQAARRQGLGPGHLVVPLRPAGVDGVLVPLAQLPVSTAEAAPAAVHAAGRGRQPAGRRGDRRQSDESVHLTPPP